MGNTHIPGQCTHISGSEYIPHQSTTLLHVECIPLCRDDTSSILTTML
jgi:hypothetical protein